MKKASLELIVGLFVLIGLACLIYLAVHLGEWEMFGKGYRVKAEFDNISGLKVGAPVEIAGVEVGRVEAIQVTKDNLACLTLKLNKGVEVHDDAIASIRTKGIIGDKFVKLMPGSSERLIPPGGKIHDTESAVEWEELISKFIHGKV
ncbi:MAG: outer membrane lipid asymmetry maintenance protein MlaD [Deltaproteobacteria bacterium]|nr:outer membrane lipid asymmetry maintenance protein MlaD [Deltaproteobacteria bacterium]MBW1952724.1 outer membrane lipid asymmetry maintenance protein MlaD [Deltaproteobacteria bacterium]MBW1986357.1 outer membrane lipid asymmetry maintenance protein MlaD [Deltaproteobacteria bacterium]MBW2133750.1 outer membrane lipid asymmetry maintenance protein MlaD [Deltaproteobacteria bacterium]